MAPNLIGRDFTAPAPGQRLVGDITYLKTGEGWLYLATVIDLATRMVVGWQLAAHIRTSQVTDALDMAIGGGQTHRRVRFSQRQGAQYTSALFARFCAANGVRTSTGRPGPNSHRCGPARNSHRCGLAWSKSAVRAILANPRYTGRQVWNRQRKDEVLLDIHDVTLGHITKMRWNDDSKWIYSEQIVHPAVIDDQTFARAGQLLAAKNARTVERRPRTSPRPYPLRGLLFCGICQRRMQGTWNNDQAYYRCTYPSQYARTNHVQHPRTVYLREAEIMPRLDGWLGRELDPARLPVTLAELSEIQPDATPPEVIGLRDEVAELDRKLLSYRATLDAGADPAVVSQWITETQAKKLAAEARLRANPGSQRDARPQRMTSEEITAMVTTITGVITILRTADPADKAELYAQLGLRLTYRPGPKTVIVRSEIGRTCMKGSCPRGDLNTETREISPDRGIHALHATPAGRISSGLASPRRVQAARVY